MFPRLHLSRRSYPRLMTESLDPLSARACRMTHAYNTGIEITEKLRAGDSLLSSVADSSIQTEYLDVNHPEWHPAPHSFLGMIRLLIYREATGESYRALAQWCSDKGFQGPESPRRSRRLLAGHARRSAPRIRGGEPASHGPLARPEATPSPRCPRLTARGARRQSGALPSPRSLHSRGRRSPVRGPSLRSAPRYCSLSFKRATLSRDVARILRILVASGRFDFPH